MQGKLASPANWRVLEVAWETLDLTSEPKGAATPVQAGWGEILGLSFSLFINKSSTSPMVGHGVAKGQIRTQVSTSNEKAHACQARGLQSVGLGQAQGGLTQVLLPSLAGADLRLQGSG